MKLRIFSVLCALTLVLTLFAGCKGTPENNDSDLGSQVGENLDASNSPLVNPLTGLADVTEEERNLRPVAIMVNNVSTAWPVQSALSKADIIYETYVEGGITRLMAVYKNVAKVGDDKIGTIRSARYSYVDLVAGHNAIYVHHGQDNVYCKPYMQSLGISDFNTMTVGSSAVKRVPNGLALEHTLYATGTKLSEAIKNSSFETTETSTNWMNFRTAGDDLAPTGSGAIEVTVPFSGSTYTSKFVYDSAKGVYNKFQGGSAHKDHNTGEQLTVKNVLVLGADVSPFPDNYHVKTHLDGGTGYYISCGGMQKINWTKGSGATPLKITAEDGSEVSYNAGNTWVCLTSKLSDVQVVTGNEATN